MANIPGMGKKGLMAAWLLTATFAPFAVQADSDPLIEGARQCTQYFPGEERKNSIPAHLLAAIATTESGRFHKGLGMNIPWPWTINVEGKGYYFNSKAEAIAQTQSLLAKGYQSIDVGCMQVNLKHHPHAFANLAEAFEPQTNVAYAAQFLHDNYATLGDWIKATAAYHSRTPVYGQQYLTEIEHNWNQIVGKVAEARASKAGASADVAAAATPASAPATSPASQLPKVISEKPRVIASAKPMEQAHRARVIQVSDAPRSRSEVLVVRATPSTPAPLAVADASDSAARATPVVDNVRMDGGDSVRRVSLDNASPSAQAAGPKFVFAN